MTRDQPSKPSSPSDPKPAQPNRGREWGKRRTIETIAPLCAGDPVGKSLGYTVTRYGWDEDELGDPDPKEMREFAREFTHSSCEFCSDAHHQDPGSEHLQMAAGKLAALCEQFILYGRRLGLSVEGLIAFWGLLDQRVRLRGRAGAARDLDTQRGSATREVEAIRVRTCALLHEQACGVVTTEGHARDAVISACRDSEVDVGAKGNGTPSERPLAEASAPAEDRVEVAVSKLANRSMWKEDIFALWRLHATNRANRIKAATVAAAVGSGIAATQKRLARERSAGLIEGGRGGWWMSAVGAKAYLRFTASPR